MTEYHVAQVGLECVVQLRMTELWILPSPSSECGEYRYAHPKVPHLQFRANRQEVLLRGRKNMKEILKEN